MAAESEGLARRFGVRPQGSQLEILAKLAARFGGLVAALLDRADDEVRIGEALVGDQRQVRQLRRLIDAIRRQCGFGAHREVAGGLDHRRHGRFGGVAALRRAVKPAGDDQRDQRGTTGHQVGTLAPRHRRAGIVARHRPRLGQPARDGLFAVLQPVERRVRKAHLLLRCRRRHLVVSHGSAGRRLCLCRGRGLGRGHHARITGAGSLFGSGRGRRLRRVCGGPGRSRRSRFRRRPGDGRVDVRGRRGARRSRRVRRC